MLAMGDVSEVVEGVTVAPFVCPHVLDICASLPRCGVVGAYVLGGERL